MPVVSITRFRVRSLATFIPFIRWSNRSFAQAVVSPGFLDGRAIALDHGFAFWTMTLWQDEAAVRAYRNAGDHLEAMQKVSKLASEMASVAWRLDDQRLPDWREAHERLVRDGKFTKLPNATLAHNTRQIPAPWTLLSTAGPFLAARKKAR